MRFSYRFFLSLISFSILLLTESCGINKHLNLTYLPADAALKKEEMKLDVFSPKHAEKKDVFIFLHGGGWSHGDKSLYKFFGKRMARKGIVGVVVNYPLSPDADWNEMAIASAKAVKWVKENISKYGGDSTRLFISGHSAGGHLAALISVKEEYFNDLGMKNPVKGVILIDAAGLDIYNYLKTQAAMGITRYQAAFTSDSANWKKASPVYFLHKGVPPMTMFVGEKTYPDIKASNQRFQAELVKYSTSLDYKVVKHKHHIPMIFQFYNSHNPLYKDILRFMQNQK